VGVPTWLDGAGDAGEAVAGLALLLAFAQFGALRRDRLRGQVDKVAPWPETPERLAKVPGELWWSVPLRVPNGSELAVFVNSVDMNVRPRGFNAVAGAPEGEPEATSLYGSKVLGDPFRVYVQPGVIAPGATWEYELAYEQDLVVEKSFPPMLTIARVVVTDATGRQWKIQPGRVGPARRVHRWERRRLESS
jgi:hypothetical protein